MLCLLFLHDMGFQENHLQYTQWERERMGIGGTGRLEGMNAQQLLEEEVENSPSSQSTNKDED